jgi:hypothetical protein
MTVDEIKKQYSMRDVAERYGYHPNRSGFISCPFHSGDREPSMKIYHDSFHCFGCGADGDIFDFVQKMEGCDFKTAFKALGGDFRPLKASDLLRIAREEKRREEHELRLSSARMEYRKVCSNLILFRMAIAMLDPLSDAWCYSMNKKQICEYKADYLMNEINRMNGRA